MSTETVNDTPVESNVDTSDLESFSADLFGRKSADPEPASSEDSKDEVEDRDANVENTEEIADETQEEEADADSDDPEDEEDKPKGKSKNRAQERISELNTKWREEQRKREALEARLAELQKPTQDITPTTSVANDAPVSNALNEDGTPKYPMGDFDPNFIRDLSAYNVRQQFAEMKRVEEASKEEAAKQVEQQTLVSSWNEKLSPALERYPDFKEKGEELFSSISGLDSDYEDYIAATIMQMDYGPDVLYYLSSNPEEALTIINSGPTKAAVMLGRIESKFAMADAEKTLARPKVSKAPSPPPSVKGASAAKTSVAPDTDDLDAFTREFVKKPKYG